MANRSSATLAPHPTRRTESEMTDLDALAELEALVRERRQRAIHDKALFELHGQRLNSQLMQGEINMGTAMLDWIERSRAGAALIPDDEAAESDEPDGG